MVDGKLKIKAESAMLGYLNAESPVTEDGWFRSGDAMLVDGEYLRILKVPLKVTATRDSLTTARFKADRKRGEA